MLLKISEFPVRIELQLETNEILKTTLAITEHGKVKPFCSLLYQYKAIFKVDC